MNMPLTLYIPVIILSWCIDTCLGTVTRTSIDVILYLHLMLYICIFIYCVLGVVVYRFNGYGLPANIDETQYINVTVFPCNCITQMHV